MNRFGAHKRITPYDLSCPGQRAHVSAPGADWLDLPTHLPNALSETRNTSTDSDPNSVEIGDESDIDKTEEVSFLSSSVSLNPPDLQDEPLQPKNSELFFIEGTNITLNTDEDIARWIEERRKNWPTRKNIAAKAEKLLNRLAAFEAQTERPQKRVCRTFAKSGSCKYGKKCKHLHESSGSSRSKIINGISVKVPQRYKTMTKSGSLFKNLVQRDLFEHENDFVLDFVKYLLYNGMIDVNAMP